MFFLFFRVLYFQTHPLNRAPESQSTPCHDLYWSTGLMPWIRAGEVFVTAWGSLMHPDFFSLMHPDFFSLMHPDIFNSFWNVTKHWEFSCNWSGQFFLACAPWRPLPRFGVAFAPWTSLASTEVWSLWSDLRDAFHARSQHLSQVAFKTLCLLLWNTFLEYIWCYVVKSFSSYLHNACDAML